MKLTIRKTLLFSLALFIMLAVAGLLVLFYRINRTVLVEGMFEYRYSTPVTVEESGFVRQIVVDEDSLVTKGDVVLVLSNRDLELEITETEQRLAMAELELKNMTAERETNRFLSSRDIASLEEQLETRKLELEYQKNLFDMNEELYRTGSVTRERNDSSRLAFRSAQGAVAEIEIQLSKSNRRYAEQKVEENSPVALKKIAVDLDRERLLYLYARRASLSVRAPRNGTLLSKGWKALENTYVTRGAHVADVVSFDEINFVGLAKDTDVIRIKEGQRSYFDVEVFRRKIFVSGTVTDIGYQAFPGQGGLNAFPVTIEISDKKFIDRNQEFYIQAGVSGQAVIIVEEGLSLITLVWEKIINFADFGVQSE